MPFAARSRLLVVLLALTGCGGGRDASDTVSRMGLDLPRAASVSTLLCDDATRRGASAGGHFRQHAGQCLRSSTALQPDRPAAPESAPPRRRALALVPTRLIGITELFDWAERTYPQYFPVHNTNLVFGPYVYRYYSQTQNHLAVTGTDIYVQGTVSNGQLLFVGTLAEYTCLADPSLCREPDPPGASCNNLPASWVAGPLSCAANAGQPTELASGGAYTFVDTLGRTQGSVTYSCTNGALSTVGTPTCEFVPPAACNTAGLSWTQGVNSCTADPSSPAQINSGTSITLTDSQQTFGSATYSCDNGTLTTVGTPVCNPAPPLSCRPGPQTWTVDTLTCTADEVPAEIADGSSFTFTDTKGDIVGSQTLQCRDGTLQATTTPARCIFEPHTTDSFGGDGGVADGGANGDGTAADGAPIVGGQVRVRDLSGKTATATTDSRGYWRVKLTGMTPPLLVTVTKPDGKVRRSLSTQPLKINGYIFIAVTGLTDKIIFDMADAAGVAGPAALTPSDILRVGSGQVTALVNAMVNIPVVTEKMQAAGINPATFDPFTTPFRPDGTGYDKVLDNLIIDTDANGDITIVTADCLAPTSWSVGSNICTPDDGEETIVPNLSSVIHRDSVGLTRGTVGWTCIRGVIQPPVLPNCTASGTGN